jgi:hypothetical protein
MDPIVRELAGVDLGDKRLNRRAMSVLAAINRHPSHGFPRVFGNRSALEGFYRLVNNVAVEPDALAAPHAEQSWRRARAHDDSVLILHDTTEFTYKGETPREDLTQKKTTQSFHGHYALAVAETEAPVVYGVVGHRAVVDSLLLILCRSGTYRLGAQSEEALQSRFYCEFSAEYPRRALVNLLSREPSDYREPNSEPPPGNRTWGQFGLAGDGDDFVSKTH